MFPGNTAVRHTLILHMETHQLQNTTIRPTINFIDTYLLYTAIVCQ